MRKAFLFYLLVAVAGAQTTTQTVTINGIPNQQITAAWGSSPSGGAVGGASNLTTANAVDCTSSAGVVKECTSAATIPGLNLNQSGTTGMTITSPSGSHYGLAVYNPNGNGDAFRIYSPTPSTPPVLSLTPAGNIYTQATICITDVYNGTGDNTSFQCVPAGITEPYMLAIRPDVAGASFLSFAENSSSYHLSGYDTTAALRVRVLADGTYVLKNAAGSTTRGMSLTTGGHIAFGNGTQGSGSTNVNGNAFVNDDNNDAGIQFGVYTASDTCILAAGAQTVCVDHSNQTMIANSKVIGFGTLSTDTFDAILSGDTTAGIIDFGAAAARGSTTGGWKATSGQWKNPYSVAGTAIPACASGTLGQILLVSDATVATPGSTYAGSGTFTITVECIFNSSGSIYNWIIN